MKLSLVSFTGNGCDLSKRIKKALEMEYDIYLYTKWSAYIPSKKSSIFFIKTSLADWTKEQILAGNALLFIGACGIAIRAIAPFLTDKLGDIPVLVIDEKGYYSIPILSGHMGGANALARQIAEKIGAEPVITTATDINKKFAVDLFAKKNGFFITKKDGIVKVSSKVLRGEKITVSIESGHEIILGEKYREIIKIIPYPPKEFTDIVITSENKLFPASLLLKPKEYILGFGCKKGKSAEEIHHFILEKITRLGILNTQILALSSISQKSKEQGIIEWCQKERISFLTYTAEELQKVAGVFTESSFVKTIVGVDNVCERAALKACGENGTLLMPKYAKNGMTLAVVKRKWSVFFDEE